MTEYFLFQSGDTYFYSEWSGTFCLWSNWRYSILEALDAELEQDLDSDTLDDYLEDLGIGDSVLYRSTTPLNPDNHPELFL